MNMNSLKKILLSGAILGFVLTSCDSFLDKQEDEALTYDKVWLKYSTARDFWGNAMSYIPNDVAEYRNNPWEAYSDEFSIKWDWPLNAILLNTGAYSPSDRSSDLIFYKYDHFYKGIRQCNLFLRDVDRCQDPLMTDHERGMMKAQARFARAYYNFLLMRVYGPIILVKDEIVDFTQSMEALSRPRNTWKECVDYVVGELTELQNDPYMDDTRVNPKDYGLATKATCQAVISRLLLYDARDLFNGNKLYANVCNLDGTPLFPIEYDANKWKLAADAAYKIIESGLFKLYRAGNGNPYEDYHGAVSELWNCELIWPSGGYQMMSNLAMHCAPSCMGEGVSWGGMGATQSMIDSYAMSNGKYPIIGYNGAEPIVDPASNYPEGSEFVLEDLLYPKGGNCKEHVVKAPKMYHNREPRFYVCNFFSGDTWYAGEYSVVCSFAKNGNCNNSHDYTKTGYMLKKYYDINRDHRRNQAGYLTFPTFRYAEIILNFIEATLECKKRGVAQNYENKAMELWADLRDRAGLPAITEVYPSATIDELIEYCRLERKIELAFENHRHFDMRTWMIAEDVNNGDMYGMNIGAETNNLTETPANYWQRTVFEKRVFRPKHYFMPFAQYEIDRNRSIVQNYGW